MIPAEEALAFNLDRRPPPELPVSLTAEEMVVLNYLDSMVETYLLTHFIGETFVFPIPVNRAGSNNVIKALKQRYEEGRWVVGVQPVADPTGEFVTTFNMMFAPKQVAMAPPKAANALPAVTPVVTVSGRSERRVLVRMPSRGRWAQALQTLTAYRELAGIPIDLEVVADYDDESLTTEVLYRLSLMACTVTYGAHKSKIEACNGGRVNEWDILVLGSDDMMPVKEGWARRVVELFEEHWPTLDGAIHLDDGYAHERVNTLTIMGRRLYDQFGYIYHPSYKSVFCDDEYTEVLQAMGRLVYVPEVLIEHRHPAAGKARQDALYLRNDALWKQDEENCKKRRATVRPGAAWGFDSPSLLLSILVATYPPRRDLLERLLSFLYWQINRTYLTPADIKVSFRRRVEIVIDDKPAPSLGEKRQRLLERARGKYSCFIDDDDWVDASYIERLCTALDSDPAADCASLVGILTTNGYKPERFEHSLKYEKWDSVNGVHVRYPNHLNAVRTSIAREVGFSNLTYTEDRDYSDRLRPRLRREVSTGDRPLYHYWCRVKEAHTGEVQ